MVGKDRHQHRIRHPHQADNTQQHEQGTNGLRVQHETEPFDNRFHVGRVIFLRSLVSGGHKQQAHNHRQITQAIDEKAPTFADGGYDDARNRRTNDPGAVHHRRIQCNGVDEILTTDHFRHKGLPHWNVESINDTQQRRKNHDVPDLTSIRKCQRSQGEGQKHCRSLNRQHGPSPWICVRHRACNRCKNHNGKLRCKTDEAEKCRRTGETINKPGLGNRLHPGTDEGCELSREEQPVIPMPESAQTCF